MDKLQIKFKMIFWLETEFDLIEHFYNVSHPCKTCFSIFFHQTYLKLARERVFRNEERAIFERG